MSYVLSCRAIQDPFEIGLDENNRVQFSCNYDLATQITGHVEQEIIAKLIAAAVISGLTLDYCYKGMSEALPKPVESEPSIPFVRVISTGGYSPSLLRASGITRMKRKPSIQVITASMTREVARAGAVAIFNYLCAIDQVDM